MDSKRQEQTVWTDRSKWMRFPLITWLKLNNLFPIISLLEVIVQLAKNFIPTLNKKRKRSVNIDVVIEKFVESIQEYEKMYEKTRDDNLKQKQEKTERMMLVFKEVKKMEDLTEIQKVCAATLITSDYYRMVYFFTIQVPERKVSFVHELLAPHIY